MFTNIYLTKNRTIALAGVAQRIEHQPVNQGVAGSVPSQGTCLGRVSELQAGAGWGRVRGSHTLMFLSLSVSLPSPL